MTKYQSQFNAPAAYFKRGVVGLSLALSLGIAPFSNLLAEGYPLKQEASSEALPQDQNLDQWLRLMSLSTLTWTGTEENSQTRFRELKKLSTPRGYEEISKYLKEEKFLRATGITTRVFQNQKVQINHEARTAHVTGLLQTYFGKDETPITETRTFVLGWVTTPKGNLLINQFEGVHHD